MKLVKDMTVVLVLEKEKNINIIKKYLDDNILNQTIGTKNIDLMFLTHYEDDFELDISTLNVDKFNSFKIYNTKNEQIQKIDEIKKEINTKYYAFKSPIDHIRWLPDHLEKSIEIIKKEQTKFCVTTVEFNDIETINDKNPELLYIRDMAKVDIKNFSLDEFVFTKGLDFTFQICLRKMQNGVVVFIPGTLIEFFMSKGIKGGLVEQVTISAFIDSNSVQKRLGIFVDGNTIKAIEVPNQ